METLLTGFGPFGKVTCNPTQRLLEQFAGEDIPGHNLTICLLPTSFARAPEILHRVLEAGGRRGRPFMTVLMLGVAVGSPHWRVERWGRNWDETERPDVDGVTMPGRVIAPEAPERLPARFPVEDLVAALHEAGLPAVASDSAGAYLCNHMLFRTLHYLKCRKRRAQAGFLHVPADEQTCLPGTSDIPIFSFDRHVTAVRTVLAALAKPQARL